MKLINTADLRRKLRGAFGPYVIHRLERAAAKRSWPQMQDYARKLGRFGYRIDRRHRRDAARQLGFAFGDELSHEELEQVVCGCFQHLVMLFMEALRMTSMSKEELSEVAPITGGEYLTEALEHGKGAILFSGHFGNWEVGAMRLMYEGFPLVPLSRSARSPRIAKTILEIRDRLGFPVIPISEGARGILRALRHNQVVPIMPDRFARGQGLTVPFFGRETHVWHTPALMAQRAGCPIIPAHSIREQDGRYQVALEPPIHLPETGDRDRDVWLTTAKTMKSLENRLRAHPEQYTWPYHLWRPGWDLPSPYPLTDADETA